MTSNLTLNLVGTQFYENADSVINMVLRCKNTDMRRVHLVHEKENEYDTNAIGVWCFNKKIGYVQAHVAENLVKRLNKVVDASLIGTKTLNLVLK